jgi:Domain of unknown function (DUF4383)
VTERLTAEVLAGVAGAGMLALGILGFVPGAVHGYDELSWWGNRSQAELFSVFQVSVLDNLILVALGLAGLVLSARADWARLYLACAGIVCLALCVYRLAIDQNDPANVFPINRADGWLFLGLGLGLLAAATTTAWEATARPAATH